jgi:signal transduction histidine kinase
LSSRNRPLVSGRPSCALARRLIGQLAFQFTDEQEFRPEDIEIAQALASQASLAIQLIWLAKAARQSAVLEERNQLAGEIHDSLAQFFTGIALQLEGAHEVITTGHDDGLSYVQRATELAQFGLTEARRSAFSLQSALIEESGLIEAVQTLVERSNIEGQVALPLSLGRCSRRTLGAFGPARPPSNRSGSDQQRGSPCQANGRQRRPSLGCAQPRA